MLVVLTLISTMAMVSCSQKPFDKPEFKDVGPNETAFLIPITGKTSDQSTLASEDYLKKNQVAAKRVQITHTWVQTGRNEWEGEWMANVLLIKVDRTPVSVTWLPPPDGDKATAVGVEDKESTGFTPGVAVTAMIDETDAAKFLYKYANKPLKDAVNSDVNNYVKSLMSAEFGKLTIKEAKLQKQEIANRVFDAVKKQFAPYGITITQLGMTNGMVFDNPAIQNGIDALAVAEAATKTQKETNLRQDLENVRVKGVADTKAYEARVAAQSFGQTQTASEAQIRLEIEKIKANAMLEWAKAGGQLPAIVPENTWNSSDFSKFMGMNPKK